VSNRSGLRRRGEGFGVRTARAPGRGMVRCAIAAAHPNEVMRLGGLEHVLKMGSMGDSPVPVGDPPTGTSKAEPSRRLSLFAADALPIPSGESPDGTGQWPVLPKTSNPSTLLQRSAASKSKSKSKSE